MEHESKVWSGRTVDVPRQIVLGYATAKSELFRAETGRSELDAARDEVERLVTELETMRYQLDAARAVCDQVVGYLAKSVMTGWGPPRLVAAVKHYQQMLEPTIEDAS